MQIEGNKHRHRRTVVRDEAYGWIDVFIYGIIVIALLFTFLGRMAVVVGNSMEPTLYQDQCLIVSCFAYTPRRGDVIVFNTPGMESGEMIKRVIAVSGDTVHIDEEQRSVTVNGEVLRELYLMSPTNKAYDLKGPVTVPPGKLFVMGDNRSDSMDSRCNSVGFVDERNVYGKVLFRIYPIWEWAWIK